jgi:hypothetical protein
MAVKEHGRFGREGQGRAGPTLVGSAQKRGCVGPTLEGVGKHRHAESAQAPQLLVCLHDSHGSRQRESFDRAQRWCHVPDDSQRNGRSSNTEPTPPDAAFRPTSSAWCSVGPKFKISRADGRSGVVDNRPPSLGRHPESSCLTLALPIRSSPAGSLNRCCVARTFGAPRASPRRGCWQRLAPLASKS